MKIGGKYRIYETLGVGAFGRTFKVTNFRDPFALKEIEIKPNVESSTANAEIEAHENLPRHENVVTFIDHFTENNNIYVVMDFCEPGNLNDFAVGEVMDVVAITRALKDLAFGLGHLHKHGVTHGNVKPHNILIILLHGNKPVFKISDFNLTKCCCTQEVMANALTVESVGKNISGCGLLLFCPPEFPQGELTAASDVFSLAVVVFALFQRRIENKVLCPTVKRDSGGEFPLALCTDSEIEAVVKSTVNDSIRGTLINMLATNQSERPTFEEVQEALD